MSPPWRSAGDSVSIPTTFPNPKMSPSCSGPFNSEKRVACISSIQGLACPRADLYVGGNRKNCPYSKSNPSLPAQGQVLYWTNSEVVYLQQLTQLTTPHDKMCGPGSSVRIATDYGLDGSGSNPGGDEIFRPSRPALGPTQPRVKWVPGLSRW